MSVSLTARNQSPLYLLDVSMWRTALFLRDCTYSNCANNTYPPNQISYPFRAYDQPLTCGLPGFDLSCNLSSRTPLLKLPSGQSFAVEDIHPSTSVKDITISDPEGCLAEKLVNLDTSGTTFYLKYFTYVTLYKCPASFPFPTGVACGAIKCALGSTYSVLCSGQSLAFSACDFMGDVKFPYYDWFYPYDRIAPSSAILGWAFPASCKKCLSKCYRSSKYLTKTKCNGFTADALALVSVAAILGVLAVLAAISFKYRNAYTQRAGRPSATSQPPPPPPPRAVTQVVLDSYPMRVVGESGRMLANMDEKSCPICLSDYAPKDTFKTLPECLHFFHAECIDEWLRANPTCPVCRTRPPLTFARPLL